MVHPRLMRAGIDDPFDRRRPHRRPGASVVFRSITDVPAGDPIALDRRRRRLSSIVKRHVRSARPFVVSIHRPGEIVRTTDDTVRPPRRTATYRGPTWSDTLVCPGDTVLITWLPLGGSGGSSGSSGASGKQLGSSLAMLALLAGAAVVAPYAAGALAGVFGATASAGAIAAVQAGMVIGGTYLLSLATKAKANQQDEGESRSVYGVAGGGNLPRPGDRIPVGYGEFWTSPDLSQPDYTIYDGEDVILYKRMTLGLGSYALKRVEIGTSTRSVFWTPETGLQAPFDTLGTTLELIPPGGTSSLVPASVSSNTAVSGQELPQPGDSPQWAGPFTTCPPGQTTTRVQLDYEAPQGIVDNGWQDGTPRAALWSIEFEYAACDDDDAPTSAWSQLHAKAVGLKALRAQRWTAFVDVSAGRYLVRARNLRPRSDHVVNGATWSGLRSVSPEVIVRPHVTELAMRIRSGKALGAAAFSEVWCRLARILPTWNGTAWVDAETRKAVYAYRDVLTASYGAAVDPAQIDDDLITYYAGALDENDTFDGVIRGPASVWEVGSVVLGPMRAEPAVIGSRWSLVRDEPKSVRRHVFTRRQIRRGTSGAEVAIAVDTGAADVVVEYNPGADPRVTRQARVTYGAETLTPTRAAVTGVSSWAHAIHIARWMAATAYYRRWRRSFSVDRQGRLVGRGDPVSIDTWYLAGGSRTGGVMASSGTTLTLDTPMDQGGDLYAYLRDRKGREWGPVAVTLPDAETPHVITLDAGDVTAVEVFHGQTLSDVLARDDEEMTTVLVGPLVEVQRPYLVRTIRHSGRDSIEIEAREDSPQVWTALGETVPSEPTIPSIGDIASPGIVSVSWVRARAVTRGAALVLEWAVGPARGAASYVVRLSYDEGTSWEMLYEGIATSGTYPLVHAPGVTVVVQAWAIGANGLPGPRVETSFTTYAATVQATDLTRSIRAALSDMQSKIDTFSRWLGEAVSETTLQGMVDKIEVRDLITSTTGDLTASIETVSLVATSAEAAVASLETSVSAEIGALSTSVTETATAVATVDGKLGAQWTVQVNTNGMFQGLKLYNDGTVNSGIAFNVSNFLIALDGDGTSTTPAFLIQTVAGVPTLYFAGEIRANSVNTAALAVNSVSLEKIIDGACSAQVYVAAADEAVTFGVDTIGYTGAQYITIASGAMLVRRGVVRVEGRCTADFVATSYIAGGSGFSWEIEYLVNGSVVKSIPLQVNYITATEVAYAPPPAETVTLVRVYVSILTAVNMAHIITGLSAGTTYTFAARLRLPAAGPVIPTSWVRNKQLAIEEQRR